MDEHEYKVARRKIFVSGWILGFVGNLVVVMTAGSFLVALAKRSWGLGDSSEPYLDFCLTRVGGYGDTLFVVGSE